MDGVAGIQGFAGFAPIEVGRPVAPDAVSHTTGDDSAFASSITGAIDELRALQSESDVLKVAAVTGDIHASMIASSRASVTLELVAAVRNKGVEAFTEIMRMQA